MTTRRKPNRRPSPYDRTQPQIECMGIFHPVTDIHDGIEEALRRGFTLSEISAALRDDVEGANYVLGLLGAQGYPENQRSAEEGLRNLVEGRPLC